LRWLQLFSAGADHALRHPIASQPVVFTSASGVHAIPVAEYTFGMLLGWTRRLPKLLEWQRSGQWPPEQQRMVAFVPPLELWGATMGILGYGSVGRQVARMAAALGMKVLAMRRTEGREDPGFSLPGVGDPQGLLGIALILLTKIDQARHQIGKSSGIRAQTNHRLPNIVKKGSIAFEKSKKLVIA
jgi:hypothetical protein